MMKIEKQKIVLLILAAVSLLVWMRGCIRISRKRQELSTSVPAFNVVKPPVRSAYKDWLRDPFSVDKKLNGEESVLQLKGIVFDLADCYALINDQLVHVGDSVADYKVVAITKDAVIVNDGQKDITLKLKE